MAHEGHGREIYVLGQAQGQAGVVLVGEGRRVQVAGGQVDAFVGTEHSVGHHLADHAVGAFGDDVHLQQAVGQQDAIAQVDVLKEILVVYRQAASRGGLALQDAQADFGTGEVLKMLTWRLACWAAWRSKVMVRRWDS